MHMCRVRLYFVVQEQLYSKAHSDQLLYCSPPLQDPFGGNSIDEVVLHVIHCAQCHSSHSLTTSRNALSWNDQEEILA